MSDLSLSDEDMLQLLISLAVLAPAAAIDAIREKADAATAGEFSRTLAFKERHTRWVNVSAASCLFEKFMMITVQGLGNLDCQLIQDNSRYCSLSRGGRASNTELNRLNDNYTLSYLWVLGAYELVRTMSEKAKQNQRLLKPPLGQQLETLKRLFERVRMPLAKMEPAKRHRSTDTHIAYPAFHAQFGISWRLGESVFISRRELSDSLLTFLEALGGTG